MVPLSTHFAAHTPIPKLLDARMPGEVKELVGRSWIGALPDAHENDGFCRPSTFNLVLTSGR